MYKEYCQYALAEKFKLVVVHLVFFMHDILRSDARIDKNPIPSISLQKGTDIVSVTWVLRVE